MVLSKLSSTSDYRTLQNRGNTQSRRDTISAIMKGETVDSHDGRQLLHDELEVTTTLLVGDDDDGGGGGGGGCGGRR